MASRSQVSLLSSNLPLEKLSLRRFGVGPTRFPFPKASQMQVPLWGALLWHLRVRVTDISTDNPTISSNIPHHSCHSFMLTGCQMLCRVAFCPCDRSFTASLAVGFCDPDRLAQEIGAQSSYAAELSQLQRARGVEPRVGRGPGRRDRRQKSPGGRGGRHVPVLEMLPGQTTSAPRILPSCGDESSGEGPPRTERHTGGTGERKQAWSQRLAAHGAEALGRPEWGI